MVAIATLIVVATLPMMTVASDRFVDVDDAHRFHDEINEIAGAGISSGCGPGRFCPDKAVTRGQMAALLTRGLGRAWGSIASVEVEGDGPLVADSITVDPPALHGFGYVLVTATLTASAPAEGDACPCNIGFPLRHSGGRSIPRPHMTVAGPGSHASGSISELIPVGGRTTIDLLAFVEGVRTGPITLGIHMTALYVPWWPDP
jgi:hypothetical protein